MSVTVKFSDEEFAALLAYHLGSNKVHPDEDYDSLMHTLQSADKANRLKKKQKPDVDKVWKALKGVVGR